MPRRSRDGLAARLCVLCVAGAALAGFNWPGRETELLGELEGASASRRVELLTEVAASSSEASEAAVVRGLEDRDGAVRIAAAGLVARHRLGSARETLTAWLGDPQAEVRATAARALGAIGDSAATAPLVRVLGDADVRVRLAGVEAIAAIGGADATVPLLDRLADPESTVRVATARALGALGDPRAVLSLLGLLQDAMPEVREATATSLGRLRDRRAVRGLLGLLRDPQPDVRIAAARALGTLGASEAVVDLAPLALHDERDAEPTARTQLARVAIDAIGRIGGPEARAVLVRAFRRSENDPELARASAEAIASLPPDEGREAVAALVAEPIAPSLRQATLDLLGTLGGDAAADALIALEDAPDAASTSEGVLRALGATGTTRALHVLLRAVGPGPSATPTDATARAQSRRTEARRLGAIEGLDAYVDRRTWLEPEALDPLVDALASSTHAIGGGDGSVRFIASLARLIGGTRNPRAPRVLAPLLSSPHVEVRTSAARALARSGVDGVERDVAAALGDAVPAVRLAASDALGGFGSRAALDALLAAWDGPRPIDHADAARALGRVGARTRDPRATARLARALGDAAAPLGAALLDALAYPASVGDVAAADALDRARTRPELAAAATEALANASGSAAPDARRSLLARLAPMTQPGGAPAVRATAAWALRRGDASAQAVLVGLLADPDPAVAGNAAGALAGLYGSRSASPSTAASAALCAALDRRRHAIVRANVLEALARGGASCRIEAQRRMLLDGRERVVRMAALDALRTAARAATAAVHGAIATALEQCAGADPDAALAQRCREARAALDGPAVARDTSVGPIDAVVMAEDEESLATSAPYALVLADGTSRMGWTGPDGWIHERPAPEGDYRVVDPDGVPLEP